MCLYSRMPVACCWVRLICTCTACGIAQISPMQQRSCQHLGFQHQRKVWCCWHAPRPYIACCWSSGQWASVCETSLHQGAAGAPSLDTAGWCTSTRSSYCHGAMLVVHAGCHQPKRQGVSQAVGARRVTPQAAGDGLGQLIHVSRCRGHAADVHISSELHGAYYMLVLHAAGCILLNARDNEVWSLRPRCLRFASLQLISW